MDLQALHLDKIQKIGDKLEIGATTTLSQLLQSQYLPRALAVALRQEATLNLRNSGTVAGTVVTASGRSPFVTAMLALDARLYFAPGDVLVSFGDYMPMRNLTNNGQPTSRGKLIIKVEIPLNADLAFETVARTPADQPIVCAALAHWPSGRTRLALGGWGETPLLALDGTGTDDLEASARNAFADAGDPWASAAYRSEVAAVLANRCAHNMGL